MSSMETKRALLVTGASRGIGAHIASEAIAAGYDVIGVARSARDGTPFPVLACDVADDAAVRDLAKSLSRRGPLWGIVNAAGIAAMNMAVTTPAARVRKLVEVNLLGTIHVCQHFAPLLMRRKEGRIVNLSTIAVSLALSGESIYIASKAGVQAFTRTFAREIGGFGITANCVAPGPIDTDLIAKIPEEQIDRVVRQQIIRRKASKADVWDVVSLLLRDEARMITGEVIHVGGA
jgi:3-oxoacyl-[acyl-carrier protein] reductase